MDKLKMHSRDLTADHIERLAELFPTCVTESRDEQGKVKRAMDFDLLRQELSDHIVDGPQERYRLDWPGKREALLAANAPIAKTLRPCREESVDFDTTQNLFIEGDNLDALKLLQETYLGKVKMIYIDPPYNTGRDFIYKDDYAENSEKYLKRSNQVGGDMERLVANTDANGRFHSNWMSMIYSRLRISRNLLKENGAIFVSIDDHEIENLRHIMNEIFGESNFIATVIWHKMDSPKNSARHLSEDHDYIVIYAKNADIWRPNLLPRSKEMQDRYKNLDEDPRGPWLLGDLAARNYYSAGVYPITTPSGHTIEGPPAGSYWRVSKAKFEELDKDGRIWWGEKGNNRPGIKRFLSEVRDGVVPQTYWPWKEVGSTRNAKRELSQLMDAEHGDLVFDTPKPTKLIRRILKLCTDSSSSDIVLDFFAGSAATADAVLQENYEDGGNRKFIQVQISESIDSNKFSNISDFSKDRIKRAGRNLIDVNSDVSGINKLDIGFRVLKIDTSNMAEVYYRPDELKQEDLLGKVDNVRPDRTAEDLLFQVLLDWGVDLALPIVREDIDGREVFFVDGDALAACFVADGSVDETFVKQLAARKPLRVVFRDAGFANDNARINVEQIFKTLSPNTEVKLL